MKEKSKARRSRASQRGARDAPSAKISPALSHRLLPAAIFSLTLLVFIPVFQNQFVNWDDQPNLLENANYRGLAPAQLKWMFTTFYMSLYRPMTWITLAGDYLLWGMNPLGYHLTSLLLHAANAVLVYFVSLQLIRIALGNPALGELPLRLAAGFAALFYSLHPLRVESVAWASARGDVLSAFFFLCALLCYLRAATMSDDGSRHRHWIIGAWASFTLSLLAKPTGMMLPVVLVVLDFYPLRRLALKTWLAPDALRVWREKIPFMLLGIGAALLGLAAKEHTGAVASLASYTLPQRLMQSAFGVVFYLGKTLLPFPLSPLYELHRDYNPWSWDSVLFAAVFLLVSCSLYGLRRRWPAGLAVFICYVALLLPVLGIVQSGYQLVADRYSYLSCLGWAILAGAGLVYCWKLGLQQRLRLATLVLVHGFAGAVLLGLGILTWKQTQVWRDSETLWRYILQVDPATSVAHYNLGLTFAGRGDSEQAIEHYRAALRINPSHAKAHNNLALALFARNPEEAIKHYRQAVEINPGFGEAHYNLALALSLRGELDEAIEHYRQVLRLNPRDADAYNHLAIALAGKGRLDESLDSLGRALELPSSPAVRGETHFDLGTVLARQDHLEQALEQFEQALKIRPDFAEAYASAGKILAARGDLEKAVRYFRQALSLDPEFADAHQSLAAALAAQGKKEEAAAHHQQALRLLKSNAQPPKPG